MEDKKYLNLEGLTTFLNNLRETFSFADHKHELEDITDYTVDTALSDTSTNPVQNQALKSKFDEVDIALNNKSTVQFVTWESSD